MQDRAPNPVTFEYRAHHMLAAASRDIARKAVLEAVELLVAGKLHQNASRLLAHAFSTEKIRVRINSYISVARQRRKTPQHTDLFAG